MTLCCQPRAALGPWPGVGQAAEKDNCKERDYQDGGLAVTLG